MKGVELRYFGEIESGIQANDFTKTMGKIRQYVTRLVEQGLIEPGVNVLWNMGIQFGHDSALLEKLFPKAQIMAIENDDTAMGVARDTMKRRTKRTAFLQLDLNDPRTYSQLPQSDIFFIQQPQLTGKGSISLVKWLELGYHKLAPGGKVILNFLTRADLDAYRSEEATIHTLYRTTYDAPNPDSTKEKGLFHVIVLEKKT